MDTTITCSLKYQARALTAQSAHQQSSRWVVGTNSLREENEIRVLEYNDDQEMLRTAALYSHPNEVWDISCCPSATDRFVTVHSKAGAYSASLWHGSESAGALQEDAQLDGHQGTIRRALWHGKQDNLVLTVEEGFIRKWDVSGAGAQACGNAAAGELQQLWSGTLHPEEPNKAATAGGNNVQIWDLNNMVKVGEVTGAHRMPVRDVDFSVQQEHRIVSAGDDCKLRFWDLRMLGKGEALQELGGHSHWVWRAQYNPVHNQLLASSSSDSLVLLWHTPILARAEGLGSTPRSNPLTPSRESDGKVHTYDEHEDSVYGLAWSAVDPWVCASLSYDGRVVINKVPKNIKYKVLI